MRYRIGWLCCAIGIQDKLRAPSTSHEMHTIPQFASACALVVVVVLVVPTLSEVSHPCSASDHMELPCMCCKKDCWYTIAAAATHELGHMPGEAGEREALATLRLIRACMISDCADLCLHRPF